MGWVLIEGQLPHLYAAIDEVECTVALALTNAIGRFGPGNPPEPVGPDPNTGSWSMDWYRSLPGAASTQRVLVFQLEVTGGPARPIASAWVAVVLGTDSGGHTIERELWRSSGIPVDSPSGAAAGIRRVAAELSESLRWLDLEPYLSGQRAEPGATPDPADM
jgi:hypothetical protein